MVFLSKGVLLPNYSLFNLSLVIVTFLNKQNDVHFANLNDRLTTLSLVCIELSFMKPLKLFAWYVFSAGTPGRWGFPTREHNESRTITHRDMSESQLVFLLLWLHDTVQKPLTWPEAANVWGQSVSFYLPHLLGDWVVCLHLSWNQLNQKIHSSALSGSHCHLVATQQTTVNKWMEISFWRQKADILTLKLLSF